MFVEDSRFANLGLSTFDLNVGLPRHRWYALKEGFSEALVRHAISSNALEKTRYERVSPLEGLSTFTDSPGNDKWLFNRSALRGFTALDQSLATAHLKGPFRLALIASLMDCCNAKRDGKCLRYQKDWRT